MDEQALAAIEADARAGFFDDFWAHDVIIDLVAEVRRLQAEVVSLKHTRTVGTARVIGP
jgi:hypothetical protein